MLIIFDRNMIKSQKKKMESDNLSKNSGGRNKERRKEPRLKFKIRAKIKFPPNLELPANQKNQKLGAFTSELSVGGARFILPLELKKGDRPELELYLPLLRKVISLQAEVRWQLSSLIGGLYESGLEFKTLPP